MKIFEYSIKCANSDCGSSFQIITTTKDQYDSIQYRYCPLCGSELKWCAQTKQTQC